MNKTDFSIKKFSPIYWAFIWRYFLFNFLIYLGFGILFIIFITISNIDASSLQTIALPIAGLMISIFAFHFSIKKVYILVTNNLLQNKNIISLYYSIFWRFILYVLLIFAMFLFTFILISIFKEHNVDTFWDKYGKLIVIVIFIISSFEALRRGFIKHITVSD